MEQRQAENLSRGLPKNAGLRWSKENRSELAGLFQSGAQIPDLAEQFERTRSSITAELKKQGLITDGET